MFRGNEALPHAVEVVAQLRQSGTVIRFLTNNSSQTREDIKEKLGRMGFNPQHKEIYSSAIGTAKYLRNQGIKSAYVVGEDGLKETLSEAGIEDVQTGPEVVVAGICRSLTYDLISQAMNHIHGGVRFVATNTDATYPLEEGRLIPGAGAIVSAIQTCSGQEPFVVGKPNPFMIELILNEAGLGPSETLVVGDRFETDIISGQRAGCPIHLVLTGVTKEPLEGVPSSQDLRGILKA